MGSLVGLVSCCVLTYLHCFIFFFFLLCLFNLQLFSIGVHVRRKTLPYVTINTQFHHGINSVLGAINYRIDGNEAPEPARALLERLFMQTEKLEGQMNGKTHILENVRSDFDLETLESDLQAALEALRKKEEDLQEADRMVKLKNTELNLAREKLELREKKIEVACSKQVELVTWRGSCPNRTGRTGHPRRAGSSISNMEGPTSNRDIRGTVFLCGHHIVLDTFKDGGNGF